MESSQRDIVKDEALLDLTTAASQTVSQLFHNTLSGNYRFILIKLSKHTYNSEGALILFSMQWC